MKLPKLTKATLAAGVVVLWATGCTAAGQDSGATAPAAVNVGAVSPALADYRDRIVENELWTRPGLSPRDRSVVTVAALIARDQSIEMDAQMTRALDNGVTPGELSEIITHLAFYAGWPNAASAIGAAERVFAERDIDTATLAAVGGQRLPIDQAAEDARLDRTERYRDVAPGVLDYTTELLFADLWLRPGLAPRDRSLVTASALVAAGQTTQVTGHLELALDNGLTREEASEALTQLAFYAGWPKVFSAMAVFEDVYAARTG